MKALLVMSRQDRLRHLALHFDRNLIRRRELAPIDAIPLGERKHGGECRCGRMHEQAVHAVLGAGELGVVVIVGVDEGAIGEGGKTRRQDCIAADDGAAGVGRDAK